MAIGGFVVGQRRPALLAVGVAQLGFYRASHTCAVADGLSRTYSAVPPVF